MWTSRLGNLLLNHTYEKLQDSNQVAEVMDDLILGLKELHDSLPTKEWEHFASKQCLDHPVKTLLHQDPFTNRAFSKPRGYAGDAIMLDFIYREPLIQEQVKALSGVSRKIHEYTTTSPACLAVKARRDIIAQNIDSIAESTPSPHILALACGHLREAKQSQAVKKGKIEKYVALDFDNESLTVVDGELREYGINCIQQNIMEIIKGKGDLGTFDFVYAAGLFDYLRDSVAKKLTHSMFKLLRSNGKMLICNFLPDIKDIGYMESFMGWTLIYRYVEDMEKLTHLIPSSEIAQKEIFVEENQNIIFLEIQKK